MHQLLNLTRASFDAGDRGLRILPSVVRACWVALTVCILVWLLKPDLFGLVPNALDPMFYTGYAINLDDVLAAAGNRHYFVTRWTSYMPMYVFSEVFGPYWGRLLLRMGMILVLSELLWRFGARMAFPTKSRLLGIFALVTAPMFVRAFTTDYPEYFVIWGSMVLCLLVVAFADRPTIMKSITIGILLAAVTISNPFSLALLGIILVLGLVLSKKSGVSWPWLLTAPLVVVIAGIVVVIAGYVQFAYRYSIGNVYAPTLDFVQTYTRPAIDGWVAPTKEWTVFFPWIYLPPVLAVATLLSFRKEDNRRSIAFYLTAVSLLIFSFHVVMEMRSGHALETSFYWSMSLGPVLLLVFLLTGQLCESEKSGWAALAASVFVFLVLWKFPQRLPIPSGTMMLVVLGLLVAAVACLARRVPKVATTVLLAGLLWMQAGGPAYSTRTNGGDLNTPRYDLVYRNSVNESDLVLDETIWFLQQMDHVSRDWESTFLLAGGWSTAIVGTYIPHPFGRWFVPMSGEQVLPPNVRDELEFGYRRLLVIYGDAQEVESVLPRVVQELPRARILIDKTNRGALGYRLIVLDGNATARGESIIPVARLDREIGNPQPDGSVRVGTDTAKGFVSFGPYFGLGTGEYTATLLFESWSRDDLGYFEVFDDRTKERIERQVRSDGSGIQKVTVNFEVTSRSSTWQLRTAYSGSAAVVFRSILLEKVE